MVKLNDIRVLRNILGDGINDDDDFLKRTLPKFMPKRLNLGRLPKKDMYGRNLEGETARREETIAAITGQPTSPAIIKYKEDYGGGGEKPKKEKEYLIEDISVSPEEYNANKALRLKEYNAHKALSHEKQQAMMRLEKYKAEQELEKLQGIEAPPQLERNVSFTIPFVRRKGGGNVQLRVPTFQGVAKGMERFSRLASPKIENLGAIAGGGMIGPFQEPGATKKLNQAYLAYSAYIQYLNGKYLKKGRPIRNEQDVIAFGTLQEKKKIQDLRNEINKQQQHVASTGFLSGTGGTSVLGRVRQTTAAPNLTPFVQVGTPQQSYGSYAPEALSRLGISQGLRAPSDKFGIYLGRVGGPEKIASILGKRPDTGLGGLSTQDKIRKFAGLRR